jgi:hypothetical protein
MRQPSGATGDVFVVSAGGAPLVAVRMKNKLSSMIVSSFFHASDP